MKKPALLLISLLSLSATFAQTTKQTNVNEVLGIKEKYEVLKSDKQHKEGKYVAYDIYRNDVICEGFYKNNLRDSLWTYYNFKGQLAERGSYKDGKKTGVWTAFNYQNEAQIRYDYTNNKFEFLKPDQFNANKIYSVIKGTDTVKAKLDRSPVYLDGEARFSRSVVTGIRYPAQARDASIQGSVIIAFTVSDKGEVSNYRVKKSIGFGCDEEALKAIKRIDGDWLPGQLNGQPVTAEYEVPVSFTMAVK